MNEDDEPKRSKRPYDIRKVGLLAIVPFLLVACPLIGGYVGRWADAKFETGNCWATIGAVLGVAAGIRETIQIIRKVDVEEI